MGATDSSFWAVAANNSFASDVLAGALKQSRVIYLIDDPQLVAGA